MVGDADRYLGPRTTWVVPFGAINTRWPPSGYGLLGARGTPRASARRTRRCSGSFALIAPDPRRPRRPAEPKLGAPPRAGRTRTEALRLRNSARRRSPRLATPRRLPRPSRVRSRRSTSSRSRRSRPIPRYARRHRRSSQESSAPLRPGFTVRTGEPHHFQTRPVPHLLLRRGRRAGVRRGRRGWSRRYRPTTPGSTVRAGRLERRRGKFVVAAESLAPTEQPADPYLTSWDY